MQSEMIIQGTLPGLNDLLKAKSKAKRHWKTGKKIGDFYSDMKSAGEQKVLMFARHYDLKVPKPAYFWYLFYEYSRARDPSNVFAGGIKIIEDALVKGVFMQDDGARFVARISCRYEVDPQYPRIHVFVTDTEDPPKGWIT